MKSLISAAMTFTVMMAVLLPMRLSAADPKAGNGNADYVFTNAKVYTVNKEAPWAEAIAIKGNKIVYVGDAEGVKSQVGKGTKVVDLKGKMVLPGFVEGHFHSIVGAMIAKGLDLQTDDKQELFDRIRKYAKENPDLDVIVGYGVRFNVFPDQLPTAAMLDEIESERPIYFFGIDGHTAWVNSKALEMAGINKDTPDTAPGFSYFVRDDDNNPTGWIVEWPAELQVLGSLVDFNVEYVKDGVKEWLPRFSAAGITAVHDYGVLGIPAEEAFQFFTDMAAQGKLPIRIQGSYYWNDPKTDPIPPLKKLMKQFDTELVSVKSLKVNLDGGDDKWNALYTEPYTDKPDIKVEPIIPYDIVNATVERADKERINVTCHCFGDLAVRKFLDAVEMAKKKNPQWDRRPVASHATMVDEADIPRFAELGATYDTTGFWMSLDPLLQTVSTTRLGPERVQAMFPMKKIAEAGGNVSLGSDWPTGAYVSDYRPLLSIRVAVTRQLPGRDDVPPLGGKEARVPLDLALYAQTLGAAYGMALDDKIGSLEVGKLADLVVLDKNLFDINPHDIHKAKVLLTIMNGKVVHDELKLEK